MNTSGFSSQRLRPLQQLVESREETAARRLLDQQRRLGERELRLEELNRYLTEYEGGVQAHSAQMLMNRQAFVARLREAVEMQAGLVNQARTDCDVERANWLLQRRELSTLDRLASCYRRREQRVEEQREQKRLDEFALRRYATTPSATGTGADPE